MNAPEVQEFAAQIGARFLDARPVFTPAVAGRREIRQNFFCYDGHWNQAASDRFAAFISEHVISQLR